MTMYRRITMAFAGIALVLGAMLLWQKNFLTPSTNEAAGLETIDPISTGQPIPEDSPPLVEPETDPQVPKPKIPPTDIPTRQVRDIYRLLNTSTDTNDIAIKSLLPEYSHEEMEVLLMAAYSQEPENVLVNYLMLKVCVRQPSSALCGFPTIDTLELVDGNNQNTMTDAAILAYQFGDAETALSLITRATTATDREDFYKRILETTANSMTSQGQIRSYETLISVHTLAAANGYTNYDKLLSICGEQAPGSVAWSAECRQLGASLTEHATNMQDRRIGMLLEARYSGESEESIRLALELLNQELLAEERESLSLMSQLTGEQIKRHIDDAAWQRYLEIYQSQGHNQARNFLYQYLSGL